jgi:hypothetical protein
MNEPSEEAMEKACPLCGSPKTSFIDTVGFECGTYLVLDEDGLSYKHTLSCQRIVNYQRRIEELEKQNHNYRVRIKKFKQDWHIR